MARESIRHYRRRTRFAAAVASGLCAAAAMTATPGFAQEYYLAQILPIAGSFCPQGTADAQGQLLAINSNQALFSLLGTTYGGDGRVTFALPDMRGVETLQFGQGSGLPNYNLGQRGGTSTVALGQANMPIHNHLVTGQLLGSDVAAAADTPGGNSLAQPTNGVFIYNANAPDVAMGSSSLAVTLGNAGGSVPFQHNSPYLAMRWCIVMQGIFPSRN